MKIYSKIGVLLLCGTAMAAETHKPPVVSDRLRGDFFKAQARLIRAADEQKAAQDNFSAIVDKMCDKDSQLQLDGTGEPVCVATIPVVNKPPASDPKK
jgi:hypothetical protein